MMFAVQPMYNKIGIVHLILDIALFTGIRNVQFPCSLIAYVVENKKKRR